MASFKTTGIFMWAGIICFIFPSGQASGKPGAKITKRECPKPNLFAYELDYDWVMGRETWYFPMLSKQDLLRQSSDVLEQSLDKVTNDLERSQEGEFHKKACLQARWDGLSPIISGFGSHHTTYSLNPADWTNFNILSFEKSWYSGKSGTLYITHTDNNNFVVLVRCWEDEERTWSVMTTSKNPSDEVKKEIKDHLKLLKFSDTDIEYLNYDNCAPPHKTEL